MNLIGNVFLSIAALIIFYLSTSFYSKSIPGGDAGVGYAWGIIILNLAFFICMIIIAFIIGWKGGFEWISPNKSTRTWLAILGVLITTIYAVLCGFNKPDSGIFSSPVKSLINFSYLLIPVLLIVISAILLNDALRNSIPPMLIKGSSLIIVLFSTAGLIGFMIGEMVDSAKSHAATVERETAYEEENQKWIMSQIDTCDVLTNLGTILRYTDENQPDKIKNAAVAKIKTNPAWEQEVIRLLDSDWSSEALDFVASNPVDHPSLFEEPVNKAVFHQAEAIRQYFRSVSHPSHMYEDLFYSEVNKVIRAIDRYQSKEIDYVPAMKEMRAALEEPVEYDKPNFRCKSTLDNWIKSHS